MRRASGLSAAVAACVALLSPDASHGWLFSSGGGEAATAQDDLDPELVPSSVKGVPRRDEERYTGETFECDGGLRKIGRASVNDEYCDCDDGSDEPGTPACSGREHAVFFCANKGYRVMFLPTSRVRDGVCDCCDGTDEAEGACELTCEADGIEYRAELERLRVAREAGLKRKEDYIRRAKEAAAQGSEQRSTEIEAEVAALREEEGRLGSKLDELREAEDRVRNEVTRSLAGDRIKALHLDLLPRPELERILVELVEEGGSASALVDIINDYFGETEKTQGASVSADGTVEVDPAPEQVQARWIKGPDDDDNDEDDDYAEVDGSDGRESGAAGAPEAGELQRIRKELATAETEQADLAERIRKLEAEKKDLEKDQDVDFGPQREWWAVRSECYTLRADGYTYKMCPFDSGKQDHVSLGRWNGFKEGSNYRVLQFSNGQRCWNGPARSLTVMARCGAEEKIISVTEPSMCEYTMDFETPLACD